MVEDFLDTARDRDLKRQALEQWVTCFLELV